MISNGVLCLESSWANQANVFRTGKGLIFVWAQFWNKEQVTPSVAMQPSTYSNSFVHPCPPSLPVYWLIRWQQPRTCDPRKSRFGVLNGDIWSPEYYIYLFYLFMYLMYMPQAILACCLFYMPLDSMPRTPLSMGSCIGAMDSGTFCTWCPHVSWKHTPENLNFQHAWQLRQCHCRIQGIWKRKIYSVYVLGLKILLEENLSSQCSQFERSQFAVQEHKHLFWTW